jgi:hypothetical protein
MNSNVVDVLSDGERIVWIDSAELARRLTVGIPVEELPRYYAARTATYALVWEHLEFLRVCRALTVTDGKIFRCAAA